MPATKTFIGTPCADFDGPVCFDMSGASSLAGLSGDYLAYAEQAYGECHLRCLGNLSADFA